jgi:hypothetical protein
MPRRLFNRQHQIGFWLEITCKHSAFGIAGYLTGQRILPSPALANDAPVNLSLRACRLIKAKRESAPRHARDLKETRERILWIKP